MKVKDEEINQLNRVIRGLRDQLTASEIDTDKTSVQALATVSFIHPDSSFNLKETKKKNSVMHLGLSPSGYHF